MALANRSTCPGTYPSQARRLAKAQAAEALHQSGQFQNEEGYSRHGDYPEERYGGGGGRREWGGEEREVSRPTLRC
jgi:hypothetical protein